VYLLEGDCDDVAEHAFVLMLFVIITGKHKPSLPDLLWGTAPKISSRSRGLSERYISSLNKKIIKS
jgi:hypothetical protein